MKVGYARASTTDQMLENQVSRLAETGCVPATNNRCLGEKQSL